MPNPFTSALSDRLAHGAWRDALPPHGGPLGKGRPFQVRAGSADALGLRPLVEVSQKALLALAPSVTGEALTENGAAVSLKDAHAFLDRLDDWANRYAEHLTWPASQHGWTDAVRATVEADDRNGMATLLGAFPSQVRWALKDHPMPSSDLGAWWKGQTSSLANAPVAASTVPAGATPTSPEARAKTAPGAPASPATTVDDLFQAAPAPTPTGTAEAVKPSTPGTDVAPRIPSAEAMVARAAPSFAADRAPSTPSEPVEKVEKTERAAKTYWASPTETIEWLGQVLGHLRQNPAQSLGVKQEWLDEQVKQRAYQSKNWFEELLLPAIATLNEQDLGCLLDHWPVHRRLSVANPVEMVSQPRFWSILKVQEPVRTQLFEQALPRMVNMDRVGFDDRYTMAQHMLEWARRSPDLFRQRLNLWVKWGGSVAEEEVPSAAPSDGDVFNATPVARRSVARWILEQGNDMWTAQLNEQAAQQGWILPRDVTPNPTTPAADTPAPRRLRPR